MSAHNTPRPRGRRPGHSGSRDAILAAARSAFARDGYDGASLRAIARDAEVDVALIGHYFGSKAGLFGAVVEWPFDPEAAVAQMLAGGRHEVGRRIAEVFVGHWGDAATRSPILALIQASIGDATAAALLREFLMNKILEPLMEALHADQPHLRAGLISAQIQGVGLSRYVLGQLAPDAVDDATLIAALAPTLQRYATGKLS
jgi:AcrR family transcriptional regulator